MDSSATPEPQPAKPKPERPRFQSSLRMLLVFAATISIFVGLAVVVYWRTCSVPDVPPDLGWMENSPLSRIVEDASPRFTIDAGKPWKIEFGRGSGWEGLDTVKLTDDGKVVLHRQTWQADNGIRSAKWETAQLALPRDAVASILATVSKTRLLDLHREYHANVADGTQWVLWITQGRNAKSVYFNNHFPNEILQFASLLDEVLVQNGIQAVKWDPVPAGMERQHERQLWDSIKR